MQFMKGRRKEEMADVKVRKNISLDCKMRKQIKGENITKRNKKIKKWDQPGLKNKKIRKRKKKERNE